MLTVAAITTSPDNDTLFELLSQEIRSRIPDEYAANDTLYFDAIDRLPRGLRAMAGIHPLDMSISLDDLAWHFLNHPTDRENQLIYDGLVELELPAFADAFQQAWQIMAPHLAAIRDGNLNGLEPHDWLRSIGAQQKIEPLNDIVWNAPEHNRPKGLLEQWTIYARKYPDRCISE